MNSLTIDDDGTTVRQRFKSEANLSPLLDTLDEDQEYTTMQKSSNMIKADINKTDYTYSDVNSNAESNVQYGTKKS